MDQVFQIKLPVKYISNKWIITGGVGSVIRQVHNQLKKVGKMNFDKLWVKSETYAGGNSVNIYLLNPTEETIDLSLCNLSSVQSIHVFHVDIGLFIYYFIFFHLLLLSNSFSFLVFRFSIIY